LSMAGRAFGADRASEIGSETSAALQTVAALVGSALPVRFDGAGPKDAIGFDGRGEVMAFVGLSEGRSLRGGPYKIVLRRSGGDIVIDFIALTGTRSKESPEPSPTRVVVLSGVREIRLGYFGTVDPKAKPAWRTDWIRAERLPDLVSIRIEFEDERRNEPAAIVALRQG
jgi:general secretion pathway protein J